MFTCIDFRKSKDEISVQVEFTFAFVPGLFLRKIVEPSAIFMIGAAASTSRRFRTREKSFDRKILQILQGW